MSSTRKIFLFVALPLVLIFMGIFLSMRSSKQTASQSGSSTTKTTGDTCPAIVTPVDMKNVVSILYPGQTRGGHYKAHGGFRLNNTSDNLVDVKAPLDAEIVDGSRYIEQGELQYMFDFKNDCGLEYRLDHLKTLSTKLQAIADKLPAAQVDDSRTTKVTAKVTVTAGEVVATAVGFEKGDNGPNVSFDFGLYDTRTKNAASKDSAWAALHKDNSAQTYYAVCWLDLLPAADSAIAKALPAGDQASGKTSDYCK